MSRAKKGKAKRAEQRESKRCEQIKAGVDAEIGQLHKTAALLIAVQFAANHDADDLDVSDAIAAIIVRVEQHIATLEQLTLEAAHGRQ